MTKKRAVALMCITAAAALAGSLGCKAKDEITYVPTPKQETQRVVINHELEAPEHTVAVTGDGEVIAVPDYATITLGVQTAADTAENASLLCTERMRGVVEAALANGRVRTQDVTTSGIDIQAQVRESDGMVTGYRATQSLTIIARDVTLANTIMSTAIDSGASEIYSITYSVLDTTAAYQAALAAAMEDAGAKAKVIAEASGFTLGAVAYVEEQSKPDNTLVGAAFESSAIRVTAQVRVKYRIP